MQPNPFIYGDPVSPENFIGRRRVVTRVISRMMKDGQSTAIIGDPHIGKTSLLNYLINPESRVQLYGDNADEWYFSLLDVQMLGSHVTPAQFWKYALTPLSEQLQDAPDFHRLEPHQVEEQQRILERKLKDTLPGSPEERELHQQIRSLQEQFSGENACSANNNSPESQLARCYALCAENDFGNFALERLFAQLKKMGITFVLLLDEFDALLHHPVLNSAEFYGGLRSLASRNGAFALIIASRTPLAKLNALTTQEFNPSGSPFFNIFSEITLGSLSETDVEQLLSLGDERFTASDKQIIRSLAGDHPYLLQAASAAVWECYAEDVLCYNHELRCYLAKRLYRELDHFFSDTWKVWSPEIRKAFTTVAIAHQASLLPKRSFDIQDLLKELHNWGPELEELKEKGVIADEPNHPAGYRVTSEIMLTWLADELVKAVRTDQPFDHWLQEKEMETAFLSTKEKNAFQNAVRGAAGILGQGATAMIEAFGKGFGSELVKI